MSDHDAPSLEELIDRITDWPYGMPVRLMEQVLRLGDTAIPALTAALDLLEGDEERDALWLIVLLGELRHADAVPVLLHQMRQTDLDVYAVAACEALAKIGSPAVAPVLELTEKGTEAERLYAYAALGSIGDDRAYARLIEGLARDRELGDVLALALAEQRRAEALPVLYEAYTRCEPWQRAEFEMALYWIHRADVDEAPRDRDWRLRYRRLPEREGTIDLRWPGMLSIVHRDGRQVMRERAVTPIRPLEAIVDDGEPEDPETCEDCGAPLEYPTGLATCAQNVVSTALYQLDLLNEAGEDDIEDLFEWLDELEADELDLRDEGQPDTRKRRARWEERLDDLASARDTCEWLIEQGAESVGHAKALLLDELPRLADRYGDPDGLLQQPIHAVRASGAKVGRNDPCPCGSGRKYKKCCLDKA